MGKKKKRAKRIREQQNTVKIIYPNQGDRIDEIDSTKQTIIDLTDDKIDVATVFNNLSEYHKIKSSITSPSLHYYYYYLGVRQNED